MTIRPLLYLLPAYIGSLKYYAKLIPALVLRYEVRFLLVRQDDYKRRQMIDYCERHGYAYDLVDGGFESSGTRVPLITPTLKRVRRIRAACHFFQASRPIKIIATKVIAPHDVVIKEAIRQGIEVRILQWSMVPLKRLFPERLHTYSLIERIYFFMVGGMFFLIDHLYGGYDRVLSPKSYFVGVINEDAKESFHRNYGFARERITIVGFVDFQLVSELKQRIMGDQTFSAKIRAQYGLAVGKRVVTLLAQSHHLKSGTGVTKAEQVKQYYDLAAAVRECFPKTDSEIVLKLHPSDSAHIYMPLKELGVIVLGDEALTDELVCLSNLCISDAWTTANYSIVSSGTLAIFTNFSKTKKINDDIRRSFGLRRVVTTPEELKASLRQARAGTLPRDYDSDHLDTASLDKIVAFIDGQ